MRAFTADPDFPQKTSGRINNEQTSQRPKASYNQKKDQQSNEPSTRCSPPAPGVHHLYLRLQGAEIQSGRSPAIANTALGWPNLGETHAEMPDPEKELLLIWGIA